MDKDKNFKLYVTHVDGDGPFLKISGQTNPQSLGMIQNLIESSLSNLEKGIGAIPSTAIIEGIIYLAKYNDGAYYRAKIINSSNVTQGYVSVQFIDYGYKNLVSFDNIRSLHNYSPILANLPPQAADYILAGIMHPSGCWDDAALSKLQGMLCFNDFNCTVELKCPQHVIISQSYKGVDLSEHLVVNNYGIKIALQKQEMILQNIGTDNQSHHAIWQQQQIPYNNQNTYSEPVPFAGPRNFPSNPAAAMRMHNFPGIPRGYVPAVRASHSINNTSAQASNISQRLVVSGSNAPKPFVRQEPQNITHIPKQVVPKRLTYKSHMLEIGSVHKVYVSFAEEGPDLFAIQLCSDGGRLQKMMDDINKRPHKSLSEPPTVGSVCLGRMSDDRIICRAIVMSPSGTQCNLFFVDFGDTELVSYYDIFDIPEEFIEPEVFAHRFRLSGVKKLPTGQETIECFKRLVNRQILTLRVVSPEGPPLVQYGELLLEGQNMLELLQKEIGPTSFEKATKLPVGQSVSVFVSYIDSCKKFFVQLSENEQELERVMSRVNVHCTRSEPFKPQQGAACCALFPDDNRWYRARVLSIKGNTVRVSYVDYGNEQEVDVSQLRPITGELTNLPAQAILCALKGFEDKPEENMISNQMEMLALEHTLDADIVGHLPSGATLVTLIDKTLTPPLNIAKRMMELTQPPGRKLSEGKPTKTPEPNRKEFSSPEGSTSSSVNINEFKRPPPRAKQFNENKEEWPARGNSLRARGERDNRSGGSFDRSEGGRQSDKWNNRQDRGNRNDGGDKSWGKDRRRANNERSEGDNKNRGESSKPHKFSVQNRLRRDAGGDTEGKNVDSWGERKKREDWGEKKRSDWGDKKQSDWGDKKQNDWGDKKQNDWGGKKQNDWFGKKQNDWGDKKRDNWGDKKPERGERRNDWGDNKGGHIDNKGSRGEKKSGWHERNSSSRDRNDTREVKHGKSNFSPRERAERSFDNNDKHNRSFDSDKSNRSFKHRSQVRELPNPVSLDTNYDTPSIEIGSQVEVSVAWFISPDSFYTQIVSLQSDFLSMMEKIPTLYKGVKHYKGSLTVGASVLARFPVDLVLYRATVLSVQPFGKYVVQYIDFGNKHLVEAKDIWQLDAELMKLPKMAVYCSLVGVQALEGEWKTNNDVDLCFNSPRYQCIFKGQVDGKYNVSLWNNGVSVAQMLAEKGLCKVCDDNSDVTLKDEPIDLGIIVGQQMISHVTHVDSLDKFYVQLDLEKAKCVEEAITNFDTALLKPLAKETIIEGTHCTVKYEDKIYRAILLNTKDHNAIDAVLPDYGNEITVTADKLMILPNELSTYYYQSLECVLHNYTSESTKLMSEEQFKEKVNGKKFIVYINDTEGSRLLVTLYDLTTGEKVSIIEPDEGAYDSVSKLCMKTVYNCNFGRAFVSHIENLNEIYLQHAADTSKLEQFLEELYAFYEGETTENLDSIEVDTACAAKSPDGNWYRAIVTSLEEINVKVQYVDYGNSETLPKDSIKKLDNKFYEPCAFALIAELGLESLTDNAVEEFKNIAGDAELSVTLAACDEGWRVALHKDGVDLALQLLNKGIVMVTGEQSNQTVESNMEKKVQTFIEVDDGREQAYVSHADSPGQFWIQYDKDVNRIEDMQAKLQSDHNTFVNLKDRETGTMCIAKYSVDEVWYRAVILDADSEIVTVRFIDYGNTDVISDGPDVLKLPPVDIENEALGAMRCSVDAVPVGTGEWTESASEYFTQLVGDMNKPVRVRTILPGDTTYIELSSEGKDVTTELIQAGFASKQQRDGSTPPACYASHINSPSEFWLQLESSTGELVSIETAMADAASFPPPEKIIDGALVAAMYPEDGAWYRAQIVAPAGEGAEVLFIDYGNASLATELRALPDELASTPALARKCALQRPKGLRCWPSKAAAKFEEMAAEGATVFHAEFIAAGDLSMVELTLNGNSVIDELLSYCEDQLNTPDNKKDNDEKEDIEKVESGHSSENQAQCASYGNGDNTHTNGELKLELSILKHTEMIPKDNTDHTCNITSEIQTPEDIILEGKEAKILESIEKVINTQTKQVIDIDRVLESNENKLNDAENKNDIIKEPIDTKAGGDCNLDEANDPHQSEKD